MKNVVKFVFALIVILYGALVNGCRDNDFGVKTIVPIIIVDKILPSGTSATVTIFPEEANTWGDVWGPREGFYWNSDEKEMLNVKFESITLEEDKDNLTFFNISHHFINTVTNLKFNIKLDVKDKDNSVYESSITIERLKLASYGYPNIEEIEFTNKNNPTDKLHGKFLYSYVCSF